jgi:type VI secretion system secreted protein Hcp
MPIYMKWPEIDGDVTTKGWEKWIDLESCSFGSTRDIKAPHGRGASREAGSVHVSDIQLSKGHDCCSQKVFREALTGTGKVVKIQFLQSKEAGGGATLQTYLEIELDGAMLSNWSMGGGGGGKPSESMTVNFAKVSYRQIEYDRNNKPQSPAATTFDVGTSEAS